MTNQPDFIVDPSGKVRDVRHQKYSQESEFPPPGKPETGPSERDVGAQIYTYTQKSRTRPGVIVIPIGLILIVLLAICRLFKAPTANPNYSDSDISLLNSGTMYFVDGDYKMALIHINMVIQSNPEFAEAYNRRGLVYHASGDYDRAIEDFDRVIELSPDGPAGYCNRAIAYYAKSEYDRSIADLDRAIQLEDDFSKAYYNRGLVYYAKGNYDAAIADFDKAIEFTSEAGYPMFKSLTPGPGREQMEAILDYMRLYQYEANLPLAYANRGLAYLSKGDFDRASADLDKASELGLDPSFEQRVRALVPAAAFAPKPGHWEGESDQAGYQGSVSFDIGTDGNIHNLEYEMNLGPNGTCTVTIDEISIEIDRAFSFQFGASQIEGGNIIQGKFASNTTVAGSSSRFIECVSSSGNSIALALQQEGTWSAHLSSGKEGSIPTESNGTEGRRIYALAIDPVTPTTLYAGTDGGVFRSTNGGGNWSAVNTGLTNTDVRALAIDPVTPTTLYAGTDGGVFKSTNGGGNWVNAGLSTDVNALAIDPVTPTTIYVGTGRGVFKSTNGGRNWNWVGSGIPEAITGLTNPTVYPTVYALAIDPITPTTLYAGTLSFTYPGTWRYMRGGVFKSTNGGEDWSKVNTENTNYWSLAVDPVTPDTLYVGKSGGVLKSTNGGEDWSAVNAGLTCGVVNALVIDSAKLTTLYAGTSCGVFKSTNGGGNWSAVNIGLTNTEVLALAIAPTTPVTLYVGTMEDGVLIVR